LNWNAIAEAGGIVVSEDIKLLLNIQMLKENKVNFFLLSMLSQIDLYLINNRDIFL